jgi:N-carbamoylputrescine amidase
MKIAVVQQHAVHDMEDNIARGLAALEEAVRAGAGLVVYAELAFSWFLPQHEAEGDVLALAETVPGPITDRFCSKAKELGVAVVLNLFERDGDRTYDCSPVIDSDGTIAGKNRMVHVADLPCFREKGYYSPGDLGAGVFETSAGKIGVAICYDRHFPEYMRALALNGAEIVVVPQAGSIGEWPEGLYEAELRVAAFQNGYFAALANRVGQEDCLEFAGESYVVGPDGRVLAQAPAGEDYILYCDIDPAELETSNARRFFLPSRLPDLYPGL